jgi:hypothetical protein
MKTILSVHLLAITVLLSPFVFQACTPVAPKAPESTGASPSPTPNVQAPIPATALDPIRAIAESSECAKVVVSNKGVPNKSYLRGVSLVFARAICEKAVAQKIGSPDRDALAFYGLPATMVDTYAILIGLGMRESDGKYCCGRDGSADNIASDTAEAGPFQASWNSRSAHPDLQKLFDTYRKSERRCFLADWSKDVTCKDGNAKNWGVGADGLLFQKLEKECPAFATEYAALGIRNLLPHWGPLKRKEAQAHPKCHDMLAAVEAYVGQHPEVCEALK